MTLANRLRLGLALVLFGTSSVVNAVPTVSAVSGLSATYTNDADFDEGSLLNVNHTAPNNNQLQLNKVTTPFPFVNIAASGRGTAVRIDVNTGQILGEYFTSPSGMAKNPSRTTVDKFGNVWVGNRDESTGGKGSIARIGLVVGGTRVNADGTPNASGQFLKAPFNYNTCVDRSGDGLIKTSTGLGNILGWSNAGGANTNGGVTTADDECIINFTRVTGTGTRTVAVDANNDLWTGGADTDHEKVDGVTGQPVPGTQFNLGCGGYGGLLDRSGVLWSARFGSGLLRYDTNTKTGACRGNANGDYGLAVDPATGNIWQTALDGGRVVKLSPAGTPLATYGHGNSYAQGIAIDGSGNVWVAHSILGGSQTTVGHLRTDGTFVGNVTLPGGSGPTGVAVDANGKVWVANYYSNNAMRIDPNAGALGGGGHRVGAVDLTVNLGAGSNPYNYSDMTGFVAIGTTSPQGTWTKVHDSGVAGTSWGKITWNTEAAGNVPAGASIQVEARAAETQSALTNKSFVAATNGVTFATAGRFIEMRVTLKSNGAGQSPVLSDLKVETSNRAPVANAGGPYLVNEGSSIKLDGTGSSDPDGDSLTYQWDLNNDGVFETTGAAPTFNAIDGNSVQNVKLRVSDPAGLSDEQTVGVSIRNLAPSADVKYNPVNEGDNVNFSLINPSDPSSADRAAGFTYAFDCGTGYGAFSASNTVACLALDNPSHRVKGMIKDKDGLATEYVVDVTVSNVAPEADFIALFPEFEGNAINVRMENAFDPSPIDTAAGFTYAFDCGSGYAAASSTTTATCQAQDNGIYTVKGKIADKDDGVTEYTVSAEVRNVAPTATLSGATVNEGSPISVSFSNASDPSPIDTAAGFTYAFDCGSGYGAASSSATASCATDDSGIRTIKGKIFDKDGGVTAYSVDVVVNNVAPTATLKSPATLNEGQLINLALVNPADVSSVDTAAGFTYAFDCGDGSGYGVFSTDSSASCPTPDNGLRTVKGKIRDKDGGVTEYSAPLTINNVAPTVKINGPESGAIYPVGTPVTFKGKFSDPGTADTHTATWSFDSINVPGVVVEEEDSADVIYTFTTPGVYFVKLTVTDDDGGVGSATTVNGLDAMVVIYDPNGGFVTGGGFIDSPAGAYVADPSMTGRANFGFISKYQKGATVPTGETEFQFKAGNLNFHSKSYEWLVISGARAQYKGVGTINGSGNYGFMLTAIDGQLNGGGGSDKFRIKIWDKSNGDAVVYDNQMGAGVDDNPTTVLQGGNIVIHSK
jgi:streptogramin lyase